MRLTTTPLALTLDYTARLISTTDLNLANRLNKNIRIKTLVKNYPARFTLSDDNTILVFAGRELYELEVN